MSSAHSVCTHAIERQHSNGVYAYMLPVSGGEELYVTTHLKRGETTAQMFARAAAIIAQHGARVTTQQVFGLCDSEGAGRRALEEAFGAVCWPVTWLDEGKMSRPQLAGSLFRAVSGHPIRTIELGGRIVGTAYEDAHARYCHLGDLRDVHVSRPNAEQARQVFADIEAALGQVGMDFSHVIRTWFWNRDILAWYGDFNKVRTSFFKERGVFDRLVPASTGIGGSNPAGAALTTALFAVAPKSPEVKAAAIASPLQCPALQYGSSFSRAVELTTPDQRWLTISGTASINPDGKTAHLGDTPRQIDLTMRVVEAILESRDMTWRQMVRGLAYIRRAEEAKLFVDYCRAHHIPIDPVVLTNNVICRDDLLFEIELDAVVPQ